MPGMHLNLVEHRTSNEGRWAKPGVRAIIRMSVTLTTRSFISDVVVLEPKEVSARECT